MLYNAMLLRNKGSELVDQAIESASWGKFQIMGENWKALGWPSATQFASDMNVSEANQLSAFIKFVRSKGLVNSLKMHHWAAFAKGYNGTSFRDNQYDTRLQHAFNRLNAATAQGDRR